MVGYITTSSRYSTAAQREVASLCCTLFVLTFLYISSLCWRAPAFAQSARRAHMRRRVYAHDAAGGDGSAMEAAQPSAGWFFVRDRAMSSLSGRPRAILFSSRAQANFATVAQPIVSTGRRITSGRPVARTCAGGSSGPTSGWSRDDVPRSGLIHETGHAGR